MNRSEKPSSQPLTTATGLPGFRTWRAVYWVVLAIFAFWVGWLTALPRLFS